MTYCVASSGTLEKIRFNLGVTGLLPLFEHALFSATMVAHGKPAPDLFLHAAREMSANPGGCVVIEDSVPGTTAATAAGMRVLSYGGSPHADHNALRGAGGEVFTAMTELPMLLGLASDRAG